MPLCPDWKCQPAVCLQAPSLRAVTGPHPLVLPHPLITKLAVANKALKRVAGRDERRPLPHRGVAGCPGTTSEPGSKGVQAGRVVEATACSSARPACFLSCSSRSSSSSCSWVPASHFASGRLFAYAAALAGRGSGTHGLHGQGERAERGAMFAGRISGPLSCLGKSHPRSRFLHRRNVCHCCVRLFSLWK